MKHTDGTPIKCLHKKDDKVCGSEQFETIQTPAEPEVGMWNLADHYGLKCKKCSTEVFIHKSHIK